MTDIKEGDILYGDKFYRVVKVTAKTMVLQQIGSKVDRQIDFNARNYFWTVATDELIGEPFRCTVNARENLKGTACWWIAKRRDLVEKYDGGLVSWVIWNYGDNLSRTAFDKSLYDKAK